MANAQKQVDKTLAAYPWLKLTSIALFGGKYDRPLRWPLNKLAGSVPSSDIRDWAEIGAWAGRWWNASPGDARTSYGDKGVI